jgi:transcriptional regulator with XRE-family HTH domain
MKTLGQFIREKRDELDLSLRELARRIDVSAAFLSDIELGRRYPSDDVMEELCRVLKVSRRELDSYDPRPPVEDLKRLSELNPKYGIAFRTIVDQNITPEEILKLRSQQSDKKKKE